MQGQFYTPISLLKKTFKPGERSLSRQEVAHRLQQLIPVAQEALEQVIQTALEDPSSPFREGNSRAIIEYIQEFQPLTNHVYRIFQESGQPLTEEQILRKLRSLHLISWNFTFDRLGLNGDHRFSQLSDHRWLLSEWELVNDAIYEYFKKQGTPAFSMREIAYLMHAQFQSAGKKILFLPELDERFSVDDQTIFIHEPAKFEREPFPAVRQEQENLSEQSGPIHTSYLEVAAAMNHDTLEIEQPSQGKTVVDQVLEDLLGALMKLEKRSGEMKEEVLSHFTSNDLESIKRLLHEKEKNEKVLQKIKEIVDELS